MSQQLLEPVGIPAVEASHDNASGDPSLRLFSLVEVGNPGGSE